MNLQRLTALITLGSFVAFNLGCSGASSSDATSGDVAAITADEAAAKDQAAFVIGAVPATQSEVTGATEWHVYKVQATAGSRSADGTLARQHSGLMAYGTDKNHDVVWAVAIDERSPDKRGVQRFDRQGAPVAVDLSPSLIAAFDAEIGNLLNKLQSPWARFQAAGSGTAMFLEGTVQVLKVAAAGAGVYLLVQGVATAAIGAGMATGLAYLTGMVVGAAAIPLLIVFVVYCKELEH